MNIFSNLRVRNGVDDIVDQLVHAAVEAGANPPVILALDDLRDANLADPEVVDAMHDAYADGVADMRREIISAIETRSVDTSLTKAAKTEIKKLLAIVEKLEP